MINIFGGRVSSYETLIDRARREAILRMKSQAVGASEIMNVKIETSSISKNGNQKYWFSRSLRLWYCHLSMRVKLLGGGPTLSDWALGPGEICGGK